MKKLIKEIEREGIVEIIGISVGEETAKRYFSNCIYLKNGNDVAKVLFAEVRKILKA